MTFHRDGFHKISMDELAHNLKISKKTIYRFFRSKEEILETICKNSHDEISGIIDEIMNRKENTMVKIANIFYVYSNFMLKLSEKWLRDIKIHAPFIGKLMEENRKERIGTLLNKLIVQGKKEKIIDDIPAPLIINSFKSIIHSLLETDIIINNNFSIRDAFVYSFKILFRGILTEKGRKEFDKIKKNIFAEHIAKEIAE
jgi:AcrR family transcriptional regulator